ncbi:hypothetical protein ACPCXF_23150 [Lysinibacillus agricola]
MSAAKATAANVFCAKAQRQQQLRQGEIDFVKISTYSKSIPSFYTPKAKILCSYML